MILDLCQALAPLLMPEPAPPDVLTRVVLDGEPLTWRAEHLYVYPTRVEEVPFETDQARRQEFDLAAVYVTYSNGEEPQLERDEALAQTLDDVRGAMLAAVREHQNGAAWGMLRAFSETTSPRTLDNRSASVRITGWRIVGG
jgi:hypothetical protein